MQILPSLNRAQLGYFSFENTRWWNSSELVKGFWVSFRPYIRSDSSALYAVETNYYWNILSKECSSSSTSEIRFPFQLYRGGINNLRGLGKYCNFDRISLYIEPRRQDGRKTGSDWWEIVVEGRQCPLMCIHDDRVLAAALTQVLSMSVRADVIEDGHHPGVVWWRVKFSLVGLKRIQQLHALQSSSSYWFLHISSPIEEFQRTFFF